LNDGFPALEFHRVLLCSRTSQQDGTIAVIKTDLSGVYRDYIACLNRQDWPQLEQFVHEDVNYNDRRIGLSGYREMLERDFFEIPDLYFNIHLLISDPPHIASRLGFDCTPKGKFLGLDVNGRRISFTENVFYEFRSEKIGRVWSVIDKAAIEAQL
jgi:predicted ester cyclase